MSILESTNVPASERSRQQTPFTADCRKRRPSRGCTIGANTTEGLPPAPNAPTKGTTYATLGFCLMYETTKLISQFPFGNVGYALTPAVLSGFPHENLGCQYSHDSHVVHSGHYTKRRINRGEERHLRYVDAITRVAQCLMLHDYVVGYWGVA